MLMTSSTVDENIETVKKFILEKHRIPLQHVDPSIDSCHVFLSNVVGMKPVTVQFFPTPNKYR